KRSPRAGDAGRSPRMRGKLVPEELAWNELRSIPAYAGETRTDCYFDARHAVDPRVCGGNKPTLQRIQALHGRSPRMRGKHRELHRRRPGCRSIPAYAGETDEPRTGAWCKQVDPRVCGGNPAGSTPTRSGRGSIPAYAGETIRRSRRCTQPRVDPRVCGGNAAAPINSPPPKGRSPRMRGKPHLLARAAAATRSIPAYAGETQNGMRRMLGRWVDPRVCGGNNAPRRSFSRNMGRSPRMRGKPPQVVDGESVDRSIPAYAGETHRSMISATGVRVDPRVCGGNPCGQLFT